MLTISALLALAIGAYGACEVACDVRDDRRRRRRPTLRQRLVDAFWFAGCSAIVVSALHSLVCVWVQP